MLLCFDVAQRMPVETALICCHSTLNFWGKLLIIMQCKTYLSDAHIFLNTRDRASETCGAEKEEEEERLPSVPWLKLVVERALW